MEGIPEHETTLETEELVSTTAQQNTQVVETLSSSEESEWYPIRVKGQPEGTVITTDQDQSQLKYMLNFRKILESGKWLTEIVEDEEGFLSLKLDPVMTEGIEKIGEDEYLDTRIASKNENGDIILLPESGYEEYVENDFKDNDNLLHRGMSFEEMKEIQRTGIVKSRGDVVGNGLTFFSKTPSESMGYAIEGQMPKGLGMPTFEYPTYHISIEDPKNYSYEGGFEVALSESVPSEKIVESVEIRPYYIKGGRIPLNKDLEGRLTPTHDYNILFQNPIKLKVAIKKFTREASDKETLQ